MVVVYFVRRTTTVVYLFFCFVLRKGFLLDIRRVTTRVTDKVRFITRPVVSGIPFYFRAGPDVLRTRSHGQGEGRSDTETTDTNQTHQNTGVDLTYLVLYVGSLG